MNPYLVNGVSHPLNEAGWRCYSDGFELLVWVLHPARVLCRRTSLSDRLNKV